MVYIAQQSFGFGEVNPDMRAQYESAPFQRGCQRLENAFLSDTGSAIKRWGSVQYSTQSGTQEAFEFYDGYNTRFILVDIPVNVGLSNQSRGYRILKDGSDATPPEFVAKHTVALTDKYVKHVATSGNDLFVLTLDGLYKHSIVKDVNGDYVFKRSHAEMGADILSSTPPVTFSKNGRLFDTNDPVLTVSSSSDWFTPEDIGDLYKLSEKANPTNMSSRNLWGIVADVKDSKTAIVSNYDSVHFDATSDAIPANGNIKITNHGFATSTSTDPVAVRFYKEKGLYTGTTIPADGAAAYVERVDDNTIRLYSNAQLSTQYMFTNTSGQHPSSFILRMGESATVAVTDSSIVADTPSYEWTGPYRNWVQWSNLVYTTYNYTANGETKPDGVYSVEQWSAWANGATLKFDSDGWGTNTDNTHQRLGMVGGVAKAEHWKKGRLLYTSYFQINWHPFMGNDGADNTSSPRLTHIAGPAIIASGSVTSTAADSEHLIWYLATSENQSSESTPLINCRPYPKNGWDPSLLVRITDSNPDGASSGYAYPVAQVGSETRPATYTNYATTIAATGQITSTSSVANCPIHFSVLVGEEAPPLSSLVFRVGKGEIDGSSNTPTDKLEKGNGPSAYWKMTGEAFDPHASPNTAIENKNLLTANELEYHQGRLFVGSLEPFDFATDKGGLKSLPEAQNLGLTIFSSHTGSTLNFSTGDGASDGLSFQIQSAIGGQITWLHSQFNQLFVGTTEEEFVITDIPMTPTSINIAKHSHYGSKLHTHAQLLGGDVVYVAENGKSIRSMSFNRNRQRYESEDLLQFAKHIVDNDSIAKIEVLLTETPLLFALTEAGKLWCFTRKQGNNVYGWSEWLQPQISIKDILASVDNSGYPALYVRYTSTNSGTESSIFITSDSNRFKYHVDLAEEIDTTNGDVNTITASLLSPLKGETVSCVVIKTTGEVVYIGDYPCDGSTRQINFGFNVSGCDKVVIGLPFSMKLAPNIPEVMMPGKGSTLGRDKNISRLRILLNKALGAVAAGYNTFPVPLDTKDAVPTDRSGFYSVPVVGQYGPQPTVYIEQAAPYEFEVSGYNAEYDFGD